MINYPLSELHRIKLRVFRSLSERSYAKIDNSLGIYRIGLNALNSPDFYLTIFAHELAHILFNKFGDDELGVIRRELTAWRIAKTILPEPLFSEERAWYCLKTYIEEYLGNTNLFERLKALGLRPLNIQRENLYLIRNFIYEKIENSKIFKNLKEARYILRQDLIRLESQLNKSN